MESAAKKKYEAIIADRTHEFDRLLAPMQIRSNENGSFVQVAVGETVCRMRKGKQLKDHNVEISLDHPELCLKRCEGTCNLVEHLDRAHGCYGHLIMVGDSGTPWFHLPRNRDGFDGDFWRDWVLRGAGEGELPKDDNDTADNAIERAAAIDREKISSVVRGTKRTSDDVDSEADAKRAKRRILGKGVKHIPAPWTASPVHTCRTRPHSTQ